MRTRSTPPPGGRAPAPASQAPARRRPRIDWTTIAVDKIDYTLFGDDGFLIAAVYVHPVEDAPTLRTGGAR